MTSTYASYTLAARTYDRQIQSIEASPATAREIEYYRENIGTITNGDELVENPRLFRFALTAYGLEDQVFAKALFKKLFAEGVTEPSALANRLTDPKFKAIAEDFGFVEFGPLKAQSKVFADSVVERYTATQLEKRAGEDNVAVRLGLYFDRVAPDVDSWFQVLADRALSEVVRTTLQLPPQIAAGDLERYANTLEERMDIADFKDPEKRDKFLQRFALLYDIENGPPPATTSARVGLFTPLSASGGGGQIISIDPGVIAAATSFGRF